MANKNNSKKDNTEISKNENPKVSINWYPGHMAKTRRLIGENLKLIDVVVEIIDARIPFSSRNPDFDDILLSKPRVVIINKSDLADDKITSMWEKWYKESGVSVIVANSLSGKGTEKIAFEAKNAIKEKIKRNTEKGITKNIKIMVVGIPNVGKSSLINRLSGKSSAKTGDKPGVTKGKQWIRLQSGIELLDTPGILWPKFENQTIGKNLAFIGSIRDEIIDSETLVCDLLELLKDRYLSELCLRYKLENISSMSGYEILEYICKKRGFIVSGGEFDTYRGANIVLDEFRGAKIGKISIERPDDFF